MASTNHTPPVQTPASQPANSTTITEIACLALRRRPVSVIVDRAMSANKCIFQCGNEPDLILLSTNRGTPRTFACVCGMPGSAGHNFYKVYNMTECQIPCMDSLPAGSVKDRCGGFTDVKIQQLWSVYHVKYPPKNSSLKGASDTILLPTETTTSIADSIFESDYPTSSLASGVEIFSSTAPPQQTDGGETGAPIGAGPTSALNDQTTTLNNGQRTVLQPTATNSADSSFTMVTVTDSGGRIVVSTSWINPPRSIPSPVTVTDNRGNMFTSTTWIPALPASSPSLITVTDNNGNIVTSTTWLPVAVIASSPSPILVTDANGNIQTSTTWIVPVQSKSATLPPVIGLTSVNPAAPTGTVNPSSFGSSPLIPVMIVAFVVVLSLVGMTIYQKQITRRRGSDRGVGGMSALQTRLDEDNARGMTDPLTYNFDDAFEGMPGLEALDSGAGRPKLYKTIFAGGGGDSSSYTVVAASASGHRTSQIMNSHMLSSGNSRFVGEFVCVCVCVCFLFYFVFKPCLNNKKSVLIILGASSPEELPNLEEGVIYYGGGGGGHKSPEFSNPSQLSRAMPVVVVAPEDPLPDFPQQSSPIPSRAESSRSLHKSMLRLFKKK
ncbi:hypothetical protein BJ741DRAFT_600111 [Chytriomyces cf. hyalinus JEL632]|nr:hypothetical protein BJ741DRAFT_600111 [Chytriomyces cf. hyalinus JEL632]